MNKELKRTHQSFDIEPVKWFSVIDACKANFGDNDHLQAYHLRPWITNGYTLFVRFDLLDDKFITYLGLVCKIKNEQPST